MFLNYSKKSRRLLIYSIYILFRKILENKIDTNAKLGECSVDNQVCAKQKEIFENEAKKLEALILKNNSWFTRNRGTLGLLTGLVVGAGMSIAIVHAVYPE